MNKKTGQFLNLCTKYDEALRNNGLVEDGHGSVEGDERTVINTAELRTELIKEYDNLNQQEQDLAAKEWDGLVTSGDRTGLFGISEISTWRSDAKEGNNEYGRGQDRR